MSDSNMSINEYRPNKIIPEIISKAFNMINSGEDFLTLKTYLETSTLKLISFSENGRAKYTQLNEEAKRCKNVEDVERVLCELREYSEGKGG